MRLLTAFFLFVTSCLHGQSPSILTHIEIDGEEEKIVLGRLSYEENGKDRTQFMLQIVSKDGKKVTDLSMLSENQQRGIWGAWEKCMKEWEFSLNTFVSDDVFDAAKVEIKITKKEKKSTTFLTFPRKTVGHKAVKLFFDKVMKVREERE